jgi:hypothetical protein
MGEEWLGKLSRKKCCLNGILTKILYCAVTLSY